MGEDVTHFQLSVVNRAALKIAFQCGPCYIMLMRIFTGIILLAAIAGADEFLVIDEYAFKAPAEALRSVKDLAANLAKPGYTEVQKARSVFSWISAHITYDVKAFLTGRRGDVSPGAVLEKRTSVCQGYAGLFQQLAQAAGLEAVTIAGWSKGYGFMAGQVPDGPPDHAWNAVRVDGQWRLVDCTWGAGYLNDQQQFVNQFNDHYFLTDPQAFIYDHLPEDPQWQLLERPLTKQEYAGLLYLRPSAFIHDVKAVTHLASTIAAGKALKVVMETPLSVIMACDLMQDQKVLPEKYRFIQKDGQQCQVQARFPRAGAYIMRLYVKERSDPGPFRWALDYRVDAAGAIDRSAVFPKALTAFGDRDAFLFSPMTGIIRAGSKQWFRLRIPDAGKAAVVCGGQWHFLERQGDDFKGKVPVQRGRVDVCAQFPSQQKYTVLLEYQAQ